MEKINLCEAIIKRFNIANENNLELERLNTLFRYFIKDNIENLFGRNEFDEDELEVVKVKDGLIVDSIFGIRLQVQMSHEGDFRIVASDMENDHVFFSVFMSSKQAINECHDPGHSYRYAIDIDSDEFSYVSLDANNEVEFQASVKPLGAKRDRFEIFEYNRQIPVDTHKKTFFEKVMERINGDDFIRIETGDTLMDVVHYADAIFDRLKEEAKKQKSTNKELKKQV